LQRRPFGDHGAVAGVDHHVVVDQLAIQRHAQLHQPGQRVAVHHLDQVERVELVVGLVGGGGGAHAFHQRVDQQFGAGRPAVAGAGGDRLHGGGDGCVAAEARREVGRRGAAGGGGATPPGVVACGCRPGRRSAADTLRMSPALLVTTTDSEPKTRKPL
jgi:hypothetical protein